MADDGNQVALAAGLDAQDAEAAVFVVEGDPLDEAGEVLAFSLRAGVVGYLGDGVWPAQRVRVLCETPMRWISPNAVSGAEAPPRGRFLLRSREFLSASRIEVVQGERDLWRGRVARLMPGRSTRLPYRWTSDVDPGGEPVVCRLRRPG